MSETVEHTLAQHTAKPHSHLTGVGADDHHAETHSHGASAHADLTGIGVDDHHAQTHQTTHNNAGADALKLDDLAAPDDNTDLDFSTTAHGLTPKGPNTGQFLKDDGTWATPSSHTQSHDHSAAGDGQTLSPVTINVGTGNIVFPATQNASAGANTFDDYEEGTFTPGITFGGGNTGMTFSTQSGTYTKIGNRVAITLRISLSAKGSSTGAALITGLPFTTPSASPTEAAAISLDSISYNGFPQAHLTNGETTIVLSEQPATGGGSTVLDETNFANTSTLRVAVTYEV